MRDPADDALERSLDLAWELFAAQPAHPEVAVPASRVLAAQPERSSVALVLADHREICGQGGEARRLYLQVAGRRDHQFVNAARALRYLALAEHDHPEALRWARGPTSPSPRPAPPVAGTLPPDPPPVPGRR
ncbi:hypothetical protein [Actinosynnema sp. NPDC020468]|uniref:hypothetical protein n=1 Tax=Actinosynnema sp. NPDC020468 TaxID=3154488 RepID=UPI0033E77CE8